MDKILKFSWMIQAFYIIDLLIGLNETLTTKPSFVDLPSSTNNSMHLSNIYSSTQDSLGYPS